METVAVGGLVVVPQLADAIASIPQSPTVDAIESQFYWVAIVCQLALLPLRVTKFDLTQ